MPIALDSRLRGPMASVSPVGKYLFLGGITWMSASIIEDLRSKAGTPSSSGDE